MVTDDQGTDLSGAETELIVDLVRHSGPVERSGHPDNTVALPARHLLNDIGHDIQRVGDTDDHGIGGIGLHILHDRFHDLCIDHKKIFTCHIAFTRYTGGNDDDIAVIDIRRAFRCCDDGTVGCIMA